MSVCSCAAFTTFESVTPWIQSSATYERHSGGLTPCQALMLASITHRLAKRGYAVRELASGYWVSRPGFGRHCGGLSELREAAKVLP